MEQDYKTPVAWQESDWRSVLVISIRSTTIVHGRMFVGMLQDAEIAVCKDVRRVNTKPDRSLGVLDTM